MNAKRKLNKKKDFIDELASMLTPERVERAKKESEKEIFKMGVRQEDIRVFTQSSISKLEARKDMKVSTLIQYLNNIGMALK